MNYGIAWERRERQERKSATFRRRIDSLLNDDRLAVTFNRVGLGLRGPVMGPHRRGSLGFAAHVVALDGVVRSPWLPFLGPWRPTSRWACLAAAKQFDRYDIGERFLQPAPDTRA